jgi:hypothetical protein
MTKIIKTNININNIAKVNSTCTDIVKVNMRTPFMYFSTLGILLNNYSRLSTTLDTAQLSQIIGHVLGDAIIRFSSIAAITPHLILFQSTVHLYYLLYS